VHLKDHNELIEVCGKHINHIQAKLDEWAYRQCLVHLAIDNNKYVGFMVYESEKDVFAYLRAIYVLPEYRDSNILYSFDRVLAQKGIKKMIALTYEHNVECRESSRKKIFANKNGLNFWEIELLEVGNELVK
jgi:hypothetical protein